MTLLLVPLLLFAVYTLIACLLLSRLDWTRRSIAVGDGLWLFWPAAALTGLGLPCLLIVVIHHSGTFAAIPVPVLFSQSVLLFMLSVYAILHTAIAAQNRADGGPTGAIWRLVLVPAALVAMTPLIWTTAILYLPSFLMLLTLFLIDPRNYTSACDRLLIGGGRSAELPDSPLRSELAHILGVRDGYVMRIRTDTDPRTAGTGLIPSLIRSLRWHRGSGTAVKIPLEILKNVAPESLTAAVAVRRHGLESGFEAWRRAATRDDAPRTLPVFFRALAEFDRFLLQPEDPDPLIRRYGESWQLKKLAREHGTQQAYAQAIAEVRRVLREAPQDEVPA